MRTFLPVSYFLLADSAGLFLCDHTLHLLVEDSLLLHLNNNNNNFFITASSIELFYLKVTWF